MSLFLGHGLKMQMVWTEKDNEKRNKTTGHEEAEAQSEQIAQFPTGESWCWTGVLYFIYKIVHLQPSAQALTLVK